MTSQLIRRFQIPGRFLGSKIIQVRETQRLAMLDQMRSEGFVPLLDLDPIWATKWIGGDLYEFVYTWQGVYVGEERAWQIEGVSGGKMIISTPKDK